MRVHYPKLHNIVRIISLCMFMLPNHLGQNIHDQGYIFDTFSKNMLFHDYRLPSLPIQNPYSKFDLAIKLDLLTDFQTLHVLLGQTVIKILTCE